MTTRPHAVPPAPTLLLLLAFWMLPAQAQTLHYLGQQVLPHGMSVAGTTVGGLSGLDYDDAAKRYLAVSDDRSRLQPARFYTLELDLAAFNQRPEPGHAGVRFVAATPLRDPLGRPYLRNTVDPEAIRHGTTPGRLWWTSEGDASKGIPPAVVEAAADGSELRRLALPDHVLPRPGVGARDNLAFESLAIDTHARRLYVAVENALAQDGPKADTDRGSPCRLFVFDEATGKQLAEHVYLTDPVPAPPPLPLLYRTNGLVELLSGHGMLLAVERAYIQGTGNSIRIYRIGLAGATDVSGITSLSEVSYQPLAKTLLLDLGTLNIALDNIEGMSWGPPSPAGRPTLILVSDDNFSSSQATRFLAFELTP